MMATKYKSHPQEVRQCVLQAARDGDNWKTAALNNGVPEKTAYGCIQDARQEDDWSGARNPRGRPLKKVPVEHVDAKHD